MATTTITKISLKLLIDNSSSKVLFAEAEKDFVDFLFGLLDLPLGSVLALLIEHGMAGSGSLGRVYNSVKNLDQNYLQSSQTRDSLLIPKTASSNINHTPLLKQIASASRSRNEHPTNPSSFAWSCTTPAPADNGLAEGLVKGLATYMVMDDLRVKPMSTISSINLLNDLKVVDIGCLEEKIVEVDMDKGLKLLKASFQTSTVLTDVFLPPEPMAIL